MNTLVLNSRAKNVNYEKNLRDLLGWEDLETRILKKSAGMLSGILKNPGVVYQKKARRDWEHRIKKLEKQSKK